MSEIERSQRLIASFNEKKRKEEAEHIMGLIQPHLRMLGVRDAEVCALEKEALNKLIVVLNRELGVSGK